MLNPNILKIIEKHIGNKLFLVYRDEKTFKLINCNLRNMNADKLLVQDTATNNPDFQVNFIENNRPKVLALYNMNGVNLINPINNEHLGAKLRKRENQGTIISQMKPQLKKNISIVFKKLQNFYLVNGQLSNMGMVDLVVKPAPFFNVDQVISYNSVMHVFDENGNDLIAI